MLLSALNTYTQEDRKKGKLKPEFKVGDTVYQNGEVFGKVSKVTFQPFTRVHMYQFEGEGFACSALKLSKTPNGKPYKMGDIIQVNESFDSIVDDMLDSFMKNGQGSLNGTRDITGKTHCIEFFQPDNVFLEWIKEYADGRVIIDVGCGGGRLTLALLDMGVKILGVDPFFDLNNLVEFNRGRIMGNRNMIHILDKKIEDCGKMFQGHGNKILLLFARPCHSDFVENALLMKDNETEALYITKPNNVEDYQDLGVFDDRKVLLQHKGFSVEKEVVYSVK